MGSSLKTEILSFIQPSKASSNSESTLQVILLVRRNAQVLPILGNRPEMVEILTSFFFMRIFCGNADGVIVIVQF